LTSSIASTSEADTGANSRRPKTVKIAPTPAVSVTGTRVPATRGHVSGAGLVVPAPETIPSPAQGQTYPDRRHGYPDRRYLYPGRRHASPVLKTRHSCRGNARLRNRRPMIPASETRVSGASIPMLFADVAQDRTHAGADDVTNAKRRSGSLWP
ncbi:MAG: hypothetical protein LBK99_12610, partial [Opitutaceae bacterium]|nr:hypothetical protein [Opitutaceae bacterium]